MALDKQKILQKLIKDFDPLIADYLENRKESKSEDDKEDSEESEDSEEPEQEVEVSLSKKVK